MRLLRSLFFFCASCNIMISARRLPGIRNTSADALSCNNLPLFFSQPSGPPPAYTHSSRITGADPQPKATVDIPYLDQAVRHYLGDCIAPSTRATYASAQRRFESFCAFLPATTTFPVTEQTLARFSAFLGQQQLKHRTIKTYLSGLRFAQIQSGLGDPFHTKSIPLLEYVLSGIKHEQSNREYPLNHGSQLPRTSWSTSGVHGSIRQYSRTRSCYGQQRALASLASCEQGSLQFPRSRDTIHKCT